MKRGLIGVFLALIATSAIADAHLPRPVAQKAGQMGITVTGPLEVVFDWSEDRCERYNIPDLPARAFRDDAGQVNLLISHTTTYRMTGADFDALAVDCAPVMTSRYDSDPANFAQNEWLAAVYAVDGGQVFGLVHNEHQGNTLVSAACPSADYFKCWYNTITAAQSVDGGAEFAPVQPTHRVAGIEKPYVPDAGVFGAFSPSNIIARDGYYYAFFKLQTYPLGFQHVCLMRTDDLGDPTAWRFWDRLGFDGVFVDPYRSDDARALSASVCPAVAIDQIAEMYEGVSWNTALQKYVLIGTSSDPANDPNIFGFYAAFSDDLVTWTRRMPVIEARLPWRTDDPNVPVYLYPTLIDHDSPSRNFETTGATAYLYFTRLNNGQAGLDRDLVRFPVAFLAAD
mgnify:FL=1